MLNATSFPDMKFYAVVGLIGWIFAILAVVCAMANIWLDIEERGNQSNKDNMIRTLIPLLILFIPKSQNAAKLARARTRVKQFIAFSLVAVVCLGIYSTRANQ